MRPIFEKQIPVYLDLIYLEYVYYFFFLPSPFKKQNQINFTFNYVSVQYVFAKMPVDFFFNYIL